jgi:hypothetical protein
MQNSHQQVTEKMLQMERQRKKDCDYVLKQESEVEKARDAKSQAQAMVRVQDEQIGNLKEMLNQTINVKIKYENIIKKLIENDRSRDYVLAVIENMQ